MKFSSIDLLKQQIIKDVTVVKEFFQQNANV